MKNQKQIKKIISIILVAIIALTANVYAANDSYKTTLSASKTEIKSGDSITITIGLKDISIESGEKGIGAYTAALEFDNSVFEVPSDAAKIASGWEIMCNEGTQGLLIVGNTANGEVVSTDQNVGTITLKVKEDAEIGETTIKLTNFSVATLGEEEAVATDNYLTLTVYEEQPPVVPEYTLGDTDGNGKIDANDLIVLKRHLVAGTLKQEWILAGNEFKAGDMNKDGKISATDLLLLKRAIIEQLKTQM